MAVAPPMAHEELIEIINESFSSDIKSETKTAYQSIINKGKAEGEATERKKAVMRMLFRGLLSVPDIADALEVPISFVTDMREGHILPTSMRDFKI